MIFLEINQIILWKIIKPSTNRIFYFLITFSSLRVRISINNSCYAIKKIIIHKLLSEPQSSGDQDGEKNDKKLWEVEEDCADNKHVLIVIIDATIALML